MCTVSDKGYESENTCGQRGPFASVCVKFVVLSPTKETIRERNAKQSHHWQPRTHANEQELTEFYSSAPKPDPPKRESLGQPKLLFPYEAHTGRGRILSGT